MADDKPVVMFDLEFGFPHDDVLFVTNILEGRDTMHADAERVRVMRYPDPDTVEEVIVTRPNINYMRTIRRTIPPLTTVEDGGRVRVIHGRDVQGNPILEQD